MKLEKGRVSAIPAKNRVHFYDFLFGKGILTFSFDALMGTIKEPTPRTKYKHGSRFPVKVRVQYQVISSREETIITINWQD
jgi:hypothetical protein